MSNEQKVLEVAGLRAGYLDQPDVISGIDLSLASGELVGIVGESGGGKSTLLSCLLGLRQGGLTVRDGAIRYQSTEVTHLTPKDWRRLRGPELTMVFQRPLASFDPLIRVGKQFTESVRLHSPRVSHRGCQAAARDLLRRLRFTNPDAVLSAFPFELSGGMAQRAAIAMALLSEPRVLLADEPTSALDVRAQAEVLDLLADTASQFGTAVLFVSHQISLVKRLVSTVHILADGSFVETGPPEKVLVEPKHPYTRALVAAIPKLEIPDAA
ncbi:MAG: ABC transporter ATP-binding protein [Propionibacteriaceae bacterium]|nr:ABC transporter ATP-binding protein [Propionibacteriaceae bacterium]